MTTLVNPTTLPDETTRLLPPSTFETTDEKTRGGKGGKGGTEGANEKKRKKKQLVVRLKILAAEKHKHQHEGKRREGEEEEDHHPNHRVKRRSGFEDASQIIHTLLRRKTIMGTTTTT